MLRPDTLAARFDADSQSVSIVGVNDTTGRLVSITWDMQSDVWRPLEFGAQMGVVPQPRTQLDFRFGVSGRMDLTGEIRIGPTIAMATLGAPALSFDGGPGAHLSFDYVVTPLLDLVEFDIELSSDRLAVREPFMIDL